MFGADWAAAGAAATTCNICAEALVVCVSALSLSFSMEVFCS